MPYGAVLESRFSDIVYGVTHLDLTRLTVPTEVKLGCDYTRRREKTFRLEWVLDS